MAGGEKVTSARENVPTNHDSKQEKYGEKEGNTASSPQVKPEAETERGRQAAREGGWHGSAKSGDDGLVDRSENDQDKCPGGFLTA